MELGTKFFVPDNSAVKNKTINKVGDVGTGGAPSVLCPLKDGRIAFAYRP